MFSDAVLQALQEEMDNAVVAKKAAAEVAARARADTARLEEELDEVRRHMSELRAGQPTGLNAASFFPLKRASFRCTGQRTPLLFCFS